MKRTYTIEFDDREVVEMTDAQYTALCRNADEIFETPEEYGDFVHIIRDAKNAAGKTVFLGIR